MSNITDDTCPVSDMTPGGYQKPYPYIKGILEDVQGKAVVRDRKRPTPTTAGPFGQNELFSGHDVAASMQQVALDAMQLISNRTCRPRCRPNM